jgi:hypothetical protein
VIKIAICDRATRSWWIHSIQCWATIWNALVAHWEGHLSMSTNAHLRSRVVWSTFPPQKHDHKPVCAEYVTLEDCLCEPYQKEVVILWFCSKIFEYSLFIKPFHQIPIFHNTMTNWPLKEEM